MKFIHHHSIPEEPARTNPDLIKLNVVAKGDDPYNWLNYATHYLATLNISDHDRLNVLRRHISSKLRMWDRQLEKNGLTGSYTVYLEQLKKKLLTSEMICSSAEKLRRLRYTLNDDPEEFIEQIRSLLSVVEPEYTDRKFCEIILEKIPIDLSLKLANWGATDDIARLVATLIRAHQLYIMRMGEKSKRSVTGMKTQPQNRRQLNEDNVRRKDENVRFTNSNATQS